MLPRGIPGLHHKYSGCMDIDPVAWYENNANHKTQQEGTKQPNELGLYDMSGSVREWCLDRHGDYSSSSQKDPQGPPFRSYRVLRGGSYYDYVRDCRVSSCHLNYPDLCNHYDGFRLVLIP